MVFLSRAGWRPGDSQLKNGVLDGFVLAALVNSTKAQIPLILASSTDYSGIIY